MRGAFNYLNYKSFMNQILNSASKINFPQIALFIIPRLGGAGVLNI